MEHITDDVLSLIFDQLCFLDFQRTYRVSKQWLKVALLSQNARYFHPGKTRVWALPYKAKATLSTCGSKAEVIKTYTHLSTVGKELALTRLYPLVQHNLLFGHGSQFCVSVWDLEQSSRKALLEAPGQVPRGAELSCGQVSNDGCYFAASNDKSNDVILWSFDRSTGEVKTTKLEGHTAPIPSLAFSQSSAHLISASGDKTIRIWSTDLLKPATFGLLLHLITVDYLVASMVTIKDTYLVVMQAVISKMHVYKIGDGTLVAEFPCFPTSALYSPSGSDWVAAANLTGFSVFTLRPEPYMVCYRYPQGLLFASGLAQVSPNFRVILRKGGDVIDALTGQLITHIRTQTQEYLRIVW